MEPCKERLTCRICGSAEFETVIDLGQQFIASVFVTDKVPDQLAKPYPMDVVRCSAKTGCGLIQLRHTVDPRLMYADGYGYRSGLNEMMRRNLEEIVSQIEETVGLRENDIVVDIGCNDGTLLNAYAIKGLDRVGFDPVASIIATAREKGIDAINDFFSGKNFKLARPNRKAKAVTSIAMFYDLENPCEFVEDVSSILADDGVWVIELSYMPTMLEKVSFDTICHEHLEYYAVRQIEWMASKYGLAVHNVLLNDVNGGSMRVFLRKAEIPLSKENELRMKEIRQHEKTLLLDTDAPYKIFREAVIKLRQDLLDLLTRLKHEGKKVYAYGASTKGNVLLQYVGITPDLVPKAAERNPEKWGRYTLGTNIPIISEEEARREKPDYFLVLPWHFFSGFVAREKEFLERGGKFIVPLPQIQIVGIKDV